MKQRLISIAMVCCTSPAVFAENGNITFYGKFDADVETVKNSKPLGTNVASKKQFVSNGSRFGIKGTEELGADLQGIYQLEAQVDLSGTGGNGFGNGTRNSHVGIKGDWGTAFLGVWDTPLKTVRSKLDVFDKSNSSTATGLIGNKDQTSANNFSLRPKNTVQYWPPPVAGIQGKLAYALDGAPTTTTDKTLWSISAAYDQNGVYGGLGHEVHNDYNYSGSSDKATRLLGRYDIGASWLGFEYERLSYSSNTGADISRNAWSASALYKFGDSSVSGYYTKAGDVSGTSDTGAHQAALRYGYAFSKRTELYGMYSAISNKSASMYSLGSTALGTTVQGAGAKLSVVGVGISHTF